MFGFDRVKGGITRMMKVDVVRAFFSSHWHCTNWLSSSVDRVISATLLAKGQFCPAIVRGK